jgi:hypothetical protein
MVENYEFEKVIAFSGSKRSIRSRFWLSRIPSHAEYASVASPLHWGCPELAPTDALMCGMEENPGFGRGFLL